MSLDEHTLRVVARWLGHYSSVLEIDVLKHTELQRTRREKARRCEDCKNVTDYQDDLQECQLIQHGTWEKVAVRRSNPVDPCGPSGKLWEAK